MMTLQQPTNPGVVRSAILLAALFGMAFGSTVTFAAEPYKSGEAIEVLFLGKWRPGKVVQVDKRGIVLAEFEFAGLQQRTFIRTQIRRANEVGVLSPSRFWSSQSGKFRIRAALLSVSDKTVTLRKQDMTEIQVPIDKLSDTDQRFLTRFEKESGTRAPAGAGSSAGRAVHLPPIEQFEGGPKAGSASSGSNSGSFGEGVGNFGATIAGQSSSSSSAAGGPDDVTNRVVLTPDPVPSYLKLQQGGAALTLDGFFDRFGTILPVGGPDAWILASVEDQTPREGDCLPTRLAWISLARKKLERKQALAPGELVMDYHPQSHRLLTLNPPSLSARNSESVSVLTLWEVLPTDEKAKPVVRWYINTPRGAPGSEWARLVDGKTVIQRSDRQELTVWDAEAKKRLFQINQESFLAPNPTLSGGRKYLFLPEDKQVRAIETLTGKTVLVLPVEGRTTAIALSEDGRRVAVLDPNALTVWDLDVADTKPNKYQAEAIGHLSNPTLSWIGSDRLMVSKNFRSQVLFSLKHRTVVWYYQFDHNAISKSMGRTHLVINNHLVYGATVQSGSKRGLAAGAVQLPGPKVDEVTTSIDRESLLILKPGASVRLDVSAGKYNEQVQTALEREIQANGWVIDPNATAVVRAEMKRGETQKITYSQRRGFRNSKMSETVSVTPYLSTLSIRVGEKMAWQSGTSTGVPSTVSIKEGQTVQEEVNKLQNPNPGFYETADIPDRIIDPAKRLGLGTTQVTNRGLVAQ